MADRTIVYMPLADVLPADRNAKLHDEPGIDASIERFGFTDAPFLDERTGKLIGGHGRLERTVARQAAGKSAPDGVKVDDDGTWRVPVQRGWSSADDAEADALALALNHLTEKGGTDPGILAAILADVQRAGDNLLAATGYTSDHLTDLVAMLAGPPSLEAANDQHGPPGDRDFWPILRVTVDPKVSERWAAIVKQYEDDAAAFAAMVDAWESKPRPTPVPVAEDPEPFVVEFPDVGEPTVRVEGEVTT